jgi:hypothetical protein
MTGRNSSKARVAIIIAVITAAGGVLAAIFSDLIQQAIESRYSAPTIDLFKTSPPTISPGRTTTLTWAVRNYTSLAINGTDVAAKSFLEETPVVKTNYILTATNSVGSVQATVAVEVTPPPSPGPAIRIRTAYFGFGDKRCPEDPLLKHLRDKCENLTTCDFKVNDGICSGGGVGGVYGRELILTYDCGDGRLRTVDAADNSLAVLSCLADSTK